MNEFNSEKPGVVLAHSPCLDGMGASWAIWKRWPDVPIIPSSYGVEPTTALLDAIQDRDVVILDFSYDRDTLVDLSNFARTITVIDHHKTAQAALADFTVDALVPFSVLVDPDMNQQPSPGLPIQALFDMERSGAMMAWQYAHPGQRPPPLIQYIQDRDLWRWALPHSRETNAFIGSHALTVQAFDEAHYALINDRTGWTVEAGRTVERYKMALIGEMLERTTREMTIGGMTVPVANIWKAFASDAAGILAEESEHGIGICYFDRADGRREFSIRARGEQAPDVSEIAAIYQGGGHRSAAGWIAGPGWEGDEPVPVAGAGSSGAADQGPGPGDGGEPVRDVVVGDQDEGAGGVDSPPSPTGDDTDGGGGGVDA